MILTIESMSFSSFGELKLRFLQHLAESQWTGGPLTDLSSDCGTFRGLSPDWEFLIGLSLDWGALVDLPSDWGAFPELSSDWRAKIGE